jgi:hypothetical protein
VADDANDPNAAIFSQSDLVFNGTGSLTVNGNYNNGIVSKDDLKLVSGAITVTAVNDGVKGKDSVAVREAVLNITSGGDGIQSSKPGHQQGLVGNRGGSVTIVSTATHPGQPDPGDTAAPSNNHLGGGAEQRSAAKTNRRFRTAWPPARRPRADMGPRPRFQPASTTQPPPPRPPRPPYGRGYRRAPPPTPPTHRQHRYHVSPGLNAGSVIWSTGGTVTVDSSDDTSSQRRSSHLRRHPDLTAGDDASTPTTPCVSGGDITITQSYEGIEGCNITVSGGTIDLTSSDDGFNASNGTSASMGFGPQSSSGDTASSDAASTDSTDTTAATPTLTFTGGVSHRQLPPATPGFQRQFLMEADEFYVSGPTDPRATGALDFGDG